MSKRFGRQQKRKLKAGLATAELTAKRAYLQATSQERQKGEVLEMLLSVYKVIENLCPNSVVLPEHIKLPEEAWRANIAPPRTLVEACDMGDIHNREEAMMLVDLKQLETSLSQCREFKDAVAFRVTLSSQGGVERDACTVPRGTLEAFRADPEGFTHEIATQLYHHLIGYENEQNNISGRSPRLTQ